VKHIDEGGVSICPRCSADLPKNCRNLIEGEVLCDMCFQNWQAHNLSPFLVRADEAHISSSPGAVKWKI
jgi:hypothetical protein